MVSNMSKYEVLSRIGKIFTGALNIYRRSLRGYSNYYAENTSDIFKVAHIKRFNHYSIMPPYTQEDYRDFEKVWATTLAGAVLDKLKEGFK
jgi:hypothetical protein